MRLVGLSDMNIAGLDSVWKMFWSRWDEKIVNASEKFDSHGSKLIEHWTISEKRVNQIKDLS